MEITQLKLQKNKQRANVYLDGVFYCGLNLETILKNNLKTGTVIEKEKLDEIQFESERLSALNKVINLISKTPKTKHQVETYVKTKGYSKKISEFVISKLTEYNYVNDAEYAKAYTGLASKTKGKRKIKQELLLKGISEKIINEALTNLKPQTGEIEKLANKYMKNKEKTKQNYSKLYAYLTRRGFSYEEIMPFIKKGEE